MEIKNTITNMNNIKKIYGFGSFFRKGNYNDIDILVVAEERIDVLVELYYRIRSYLCILEMKYGIIFDITIFTESEFLARPLRDMDDLVLITERSASDLLS